jgi:hypothetical protein
MSNKALEICYDFLFSCRKSLMRYFRLMKKYFFRKVILFWKKEKQPMNIIFWRKVWLVHLSMILTEMK